MNELSVFRNSWKHRGLLRPAKASRDRLLVDIEKTNVEVSVPFLWQFEAAKNKLMIWVTGDNK